MQTVGESELRSIYACVDVFLARFAYRYRLDASDLDDIRQDAVVCWWSYTQRTKTMIPANALARVIARRQLYGHLRREISRRRHEGNHEVAWIEEKSEEEVLGTDTIFEVIHALPVDQRQLVHDRIEGLTHREIAREQGVDERTVRQRWTKTKSTLKRRLRSRLRQDHDGRNAELLLRV